MLLLSSMSMVHWLLISNVLLLIGAVVGFFLFKRKYENDLQRWQKQTHKLRHDFDAMSKSNFGMGRCVKKLEQRLVENERKPSLATSDEALYQQAQRLVSMGASADDLVSSCGVARAEAELLVSMNRQVAH
ncbi:MAG: biopolymer transport protein ExbB/TolQ [Glaciecola sp.]|jgi:biopolymer transport protein ExbB/TolQ